jgi:hypothetical protein
MVALFFATSFGLAIVAKDKTGAVDDLDTFLPQTETPATLDVDMQAVDDVPAVGEGDVPVVDDGLPVMTADDVCRRARCRTALTPTTYRRFRSREQNLPKWWNW